MNAPFNDQVRNDYRRPVTVASTVGTNACSSSSSGKKRSLPDDELSIDTSREVDVEQGQSEDEYENEGNDENEGDDEEVNNQPGTTKDQEKNMISYRFIITNPNKAVMERGEKYIIPSLSYESLIVEAEQDMRNGTVHEWHPNLWAVPLCGGSTINGTTKCKSIPLSVLLFVKKRSYGDKKLIDFLNIFPKINCYCYCQKILPFNCTLYCKLIELATTVKAYDNRGNGYKKKTAAFTTVANMFNNHTGLFLEYFKSKSNGIVSHTTVKRKLDYLCDSFTKIYANHDDRIVVGRNSSHFHSSLYYLSKSRSESARATSHDDELLASNSLGNYYLLIKITNPNLNI